MIQGKKVVVTGSCSGIGLGIAQAFAAQGCQILLNGLEDEKNIGNVWKEFPKKEGIFYCQADLSQSEACQYLIAEAHRLLGGVDILVNNAGVQFTAPIVEFPEDKWHAILALNLSSCFYTTKAALPYMYKQGYGRLIHIASAHGLVGSVHKSAYVAAKHGLVGFSKVVALEAAGTGVTSNCICPGFVLTPLIQKQIEDMSKQEGISFDEAKKGLVAAKHPSGDFVTVDALGAVAVMLSGPAGDQITGTAYAMDGGWTAA